jgi:hypothetical protein
LAEKGSFSPVNAVGHLHELKDSFSIQTVQFDYPPAQDGLPQRVFLCHCTIVTNDGRTLTASGSETTKKAAKQKAAQIALQAWTLHTIEQSWQEHSK